MTECKLCQTSLTYQSETIFGTWWYCETCKKEMYTGKEIDPKLIESTLRHLREELFMRQISKLTDEQLVTEIKNYEKILRRGK